MSYGAEVPKEYLRNAFHSGALDVTGSFEMVRGFVQIFAGEMDALVAISQCRFLDKTQIDFLMKLAKPTSESAGHYLTWVRRAAAR